MKKLILAFALIIASATFVTAQAQHISVSININSQPAWGPVGYDYVDYYYIPEIDVYYNVPMSMFYYLDRGRWISSRYLPYSYRNYNLYGMYKVVLNTREPWHYHRHHVRDYARYRDVRNQHVIYYAKDKRYNHSRRNTVAWYEGGKHNKPPKYNNDKRNDYRYNDRNHNRSDKRNNDGYRNQTRSTRVDKDNNRGYNNDRRNNSARNNNRNDRATAPRNQRNNNSSTENRNSRQQPTTRSSSSQSYLVNNAGTKTEKRSSDRSSQRSSSRSKSERTSSTRGNR